MTDQQIIVRRTQLPSVLGLSIATIDRLRHLGDFPTAIKLGAQAVGFFRADIDAWLASRKSAKA